MNFKSNFNLVAQKGKGIYINPHRAFLLLELLGGIKNEKERARVNRDQHPKGLEENK